MRLRKPAIFSSVYQYEGQLQVVRPDRDGACLRCVWPEANLNFAWRDPFLHRALGPAWLHLAITACALVVFVYWPTHWVLGRLFPAASSTSGTLQ